MMVVILYYKMKSPNPRTFPPFLRFGGVTPCSCDDNSCISGGANRYDALAIGATPGTRSILNSNCLSGGIPGNSSGNTSVNSLTTRTYDTET